MNFTFQRNPARLLELYGITEISDRMQEKAFLEKLWQSKGEELRPLVLVIGGFIDQFLGNSYSVSRKYPTDLREKHDVWFREHYEGRAMRKLVAFYASHGKQVVLIGHSWGGDAAVNAVAKKGAAPIELLVSLDPVSRKGPPRHKLPNVKHWLNIHIDYSQSTWLDIPNLVARIGGPWEHVESADVNLSCPPQMTHAWAWGMFERYAEPVLRERLS